MITSSRLLFVSLLIFISLQCFGQEYSSRAVDGQGFDSVFQDLESGNFSGTANSILILKDAENKEALLDFQGSHAKLDIEKDEHEVYDVSYKTYTGKTEITYQTYGSANAFGIKLGVSITTYNSLTELAI